MAMEKIIIYVAGNPSLYPLEYYDAGTQRYEGIIPELLERFSEQSRYDVRYYQPGGEDRRAGLAANRQVDLISGCTADESFDHTQGDGVWLLESLENGEDVVYQLRFTDQAPEAFQAELQQFLSGISQEEKVGMILQVGEETHSVQAGWLWGGIIALAVAVIALSAALVLLARWYRRRLKKDREDKERDEVTGIGNEAYLDHGFRTLVQDRTRILYSVLCFYTATDRMDRICGPEETKQYLRHTAVVLNEYLGRNDLLARVQGIGFVMLKQSDGQGVETWLPTALQRIRDFSRQYGRQYSCEVSCGIYSLQEDDRDLDEAVFKAFQSAQKACREETDYIVCSQDLIHELAQERRLRGEIASAFERGEFLFYIQFYVDSRTYQVVGGEALARWQHPEKGFLLPGSFIPLMERENMIDRMDFYILEKACAFLEDLRKQGVYDFPISCNFSRKSFAAPDFVDRCAQVINRYTFIRDRLIFELTESTQARDMEQIRQNVRRVKQLGVQVVLDDFGVGFTSFYDLQEYPVDGVKLDKELVDHINTSKGRTIVGAMVKIGHELGLTTLAEGVENDEQLKILQELNCDAIQGFRFYHPIPSWEAEKKILERMH